MGLCPWSCDVDEFSQYRSTHVMAHKPMTYGVGAPEAAPYVPLCRLVTAGGLFCSVRKNSFPLGGRTNSSTVRKHGGRRNSVPGCSFLLSGSAMTLSMPGTCSAICGLYSEHAMSRASSRAIMPVPYPLVLSFRHITKALMLSDFTLKTTLW